MPNLKDASEFRCQQWVAKPIKEVFPFFSNEKNLEVITPRWVNFKVVRKSTQEIMEGTEIDYTISLHGIPMRWKSKITNWSPPKQFVDLQLKGPYSLWHHTHQFEEKDGGTLMTDIVLYKVPFGLFGKAVAGQFVRKDIEKIFAYRQKKITELFSINKL